MKKLVVFALIIVGFIFNASGEEFLERINLPEGSMNIFSTNIPDGNGVYIYYYIIYKDYTAQVFDMDFKRIAVLDDVVPNQGWGNCFGDVQGKVELIQRGIGLDEFVYFATSKPDDPSPWWGIKNSSGDILFKESGKSANTIYRNSLSPGGIVVFDFCWVDGRTYKINWQSGNVGLTSLSKQSKEAFPNPVKRGETFNIDIDNLKLTDNTVLMISSITGSIKSKRTVDMDDWSVAVSTGDMEPGIYIYSLISNNKVLKSGRIVVE